MVQFSADIQSPRSFQDVQGVASFYFKSTKPHIYKIRILTRYKILLLALLTHRNLQVYSDRTIKIFQSRS